MPFGGNEKTVMKGFSLWTEQPGANRHHLAAVWWPKKQFLCQFLLLWNPEWSSGVTMENHILTTFWCPWEVPGDPWRRQIEVSVRFELPFVQMKCCPLRLLPWSRRWRAQSGTSLWRLRAQKSRLWVGFHFFGIHFYVLLAHGKSRFFDILTTFWWLPEGSWGGVAGQMPTPQQPQWPPKWPKMMCLAASFGQADLETCGSTLQMHRPLRSSGMTP